MSGLDLVDQVRHLVVVRLVLCARRKRAYQSDIAKTVGLANGNAVSMYIHEGLMALAEIWDIVEKEQK